MKKNVITIIVIVFAISLLIDISIYSNPNNDTMEEYTEEITEEYPMQSLDFFAMDTLISLTASGKNAHLALQESKDYILYLENLISFTIETSELSLLNANNGKPLQVSDEFYKIMETALSYAKLTDGVFDPTIASITQLWELSDTIPTQNEIDLTLQRVSYQNIILLENNYIQLLNDATIELGAMGKGIATDYVKEIYMKNKIDKGIISLAGNVYLIGEKDVDTPWTVGITDPQNHYQHNISVKLTDTSVVTAGAYERYFWHDGEFYHHIFDNTTGYPTKQDITSVTIVSQNSTLADVYSTTLFTMGFEPAIEFLEENTEIDAIIINADNKVFISENLKNVTTLGAKYLTFWYSYDKLTFVYYLLF